MTFRWSSGDTTRSTKSHWLCPRLESWPEKWFSDSVPEIKWLGVWRGHCRPGIRAQLQEPWVKTFTFTYPFWSSQNVSAYQGRSAFAVWYWGRFLAVPKNGHWCNDSGEKAWCLIWRRTCQRRYHLDDSLLRQTIRTKIEQKSFSKGLSWQDGF